VELKASIVITTKNRKDELTKAIESCLIQKGNPEILIFDDGSDDGTYEFVKTKYPTIKIHRELNSLGLINARTKAATLVTGDIIFSIDDDAIFSKDNIIKDTIKDFENTLIGAVAIPLININYSPEIIQLAPNSKDVFFTRQFIGTAHALRKNIFIKIDGYRKFLVRQGEEMDYCIRMLDAGYMVKLGSSNPIIHFESPIRDRKMIKYFEARNNIIFILQNVPLVFLFIHLIMNIYNLLYKGGPCYNIVLKGIISGFNDFIILAEIKRRPVSIKTYFKHRKLKVNR